MTCVVVYSILVCMGPCIHTCRVDGVPAAIKYGRAGSATELALGHEASVYRAPGMKQIQVNCGVLSVCVCVCVSFVRYTAGDQ